MRLAIISPVGLLNRFSTHTNTQMALADLVNRYPEYATWFRKRKHKADFIILDNSFHELRYALTGQALYRAYMAIGTADVVICPDAWPDPIKTEWLTTKFLESKYTGLMVRASRTVKFMFVAHGEVLDDFRRAASFCKRNGLYYIGISTDNAQVGGLSRSDITKVLRSNGFLGKIHWLGIGNPVRKTLTEALNCGVNSIDGSSPVKMALRGVDLDIEGLVKPTLNLEDGNSYPESVLLKAEKVIKDLAGEYASTTSNTFG